MTKADKKIEMIGKLEVKLPNDSDASEKDFKIWYDKGEIEYNNKSYPEAIISFTEAIKNTVHSPSKAYSLTYRGAAYFHYGSSPEAIADFNEAIGFQIKEHALPYYNKGLILSLDPSKYEEAIKNFKKAIEVNPKFSGSYAALYTLYKREGDDENAFRMRQLLRELAMDNIGQLKKQLDEAKKERKE
jgi:tetratricopeptide (TPR) repeat protein